MSRNEEIYMKFIVAEKDSIFCGYKRKKARGKYRYKNN